MADYISRDEIFSVWRSMPKPASISSLTDAINQTPAADVEPVCRGIPSEQRKVPGMAGKGGRKMNSELTYMDCWHFISPLIPVSSDFSQDVYCMVFHALKEAEKERIAEKEKRKEAPNDH